MCGGPLKCGGPCSAEHVRTLVNPALPNPNLNTISCSNVMVYQQSILHTQAAVIKQQL